MIVRKFCVLTRSGKGGEVAGYVVSDAQNEKEWNIRPVLAEFHISQVHDEDSQKYRAQMYRDYMNKIVDATETAYEQTVLCDVLKA